MNNLKKYREKKGYTQEMLARMVGVSTRRYQAYEADTGEPKVRLANKIAYLIGKSPKSIWPDFP